MAASNHSPQSLSLNEQVPQQMSLRIEIPLDPPKQEPKLSMLAVHARIIVWRCSIELMSKP